MNNKVVFEFPLKPWTFFYSTTLPMSVLFTGIVLLSLYAGGIYVRIITISIVLKIAHSSYYNTVKLVRFRENTVELEFSYTKEIRVYNLRDFNSVLSTRIGITDWYPSYYAILKKEFGKKNRIPFFCPNEQLHVFRKYLAENQIRFVDHDTP